MNRILFLSFFCAASMAADVARLPEWERNAELAMLLTSGNSSVSTIGLGLGATYRPDPWTVKGKANYLSSTASGTKSAELFSGELRGERKITDSLSGFLAGSYLKNRFAGFDDRFGAEAGVSYWLLQEEAHTLSSELGLGYLKENRTDLVNQSFLTGRAGLEYKWKLSSSAEFSNLLSFLENLKTTSDWRLSNTASITAVLTEILSLKASFRLDHLNVPVTGKKSIDTTTTVALVAKF